MDIIELINEFGFLVVVSGFIASVIAGIIKTPIARKLKSKVMPIEDKENGYITEKQYSVKIKNITLTTVSVVSVLIIVALRYLSGGGLAIFKDITLYSDILLSITASSIFYGLYEGAGKVSLKKWLHKLFNFLKTKKSTKKSSLADLLLEVVEDLTNTKFSDSEKEKIKQDLKNKNIK